MDHGHMDHGMPGMGQGHKCNMNVCNAWSPELGLGATVTYKQQMLFTWDTTDLCIVFHDWHVKGTGSLIISLLAIVLLTAGYEAVREASRRYEAHASKLAEGRRGGDDVRGECGIS